MADSLNPVANIYQGFWTDWSHGKVWGLTLTLCPTHSTILTNALAMFVTVFGMQLWTIIRYFVHQYGSSIQPDLATPHLNQQQRVLRNAGSALSTARFMLTIAWKSRKASGKRSLRAWTIGVLAFVYAITFMLAVIFSNQAIAAPSVNGGSAVLLRNGNCGVWNQTYLAYALQNGGYETGADFDVHVDYIASINSEVQYSLEYAQECYLNKPNSTTTNDVTSACRTLKQPSLGWTTSNASCPFNTTLCHPDSIPIMFETDIFDSFDHFGINAQPKDRLTYQRRTVCSVLNPEGYIQGWDGEIANSSSPKPPAQSADAYFGFNFAHGTNWTYSYSNFASFYTNYTDQFANPYQLDVEQAYGPVDGSSSDSDFEPIAEFNQTNFDITLFFLSFVGMYVGPVTDPWFSAVKPEFFDNPSVVLQTRYAREVAISPIGCKAQHQMCTNKGICTGFLGFDQVQENNEFNSVLTPKQNTTFNRLLEAASVSTIGKVVEDIQQTTAPLLASNMIVSGLSGAVLSEQLSTTQWISELQYWHSISLAQLQRVVAQWATGQFAPSLEYIVPAKEPNDVWFCNNMVIPSTTYQSFKAVPIILIVVFGSLVIIVSIFMQELSACARRWAKSSSPTWHWDDDDLFGLPKYVRKSLRRPVPPPKDYDTCSTVRQSPDSLNETISTTFTPRAEKSYSICPTPSHMIHRPEMSSVDPQSPGLLGDVRPQAVRGLNTAHDTPFLDKPPMPPAKTFRPFHKPLYHPRSPVNMFQTWI